MVTLAIRHSFGHSKASTQFLAETVESAPGKTYLKNPREGPSYQDFVALREFAFLAEGVLPA
jgi:hypothetical protein